MAANPDDYDVPRGCRFATAVMALGCLLSLALLGVTVVAAIVSALRAAPIP